MSFGRPAFVSLPGAMTRTDAIGALGNDDVTPACRVGIGVVVFDWRSICWRIAMSSFSSFSRWESASESWPCSSTTRPCVGACDGAATG